MFYQINENLTEIAPEEIRPEVLSAGFVTCAELAQMGRRFGLDDDTIQASQRANPMFRTAVDVRENYTFSELRIVNRDGSEDFVSLFILKNFLLIVDIEDQDNSTIHSFLKALKRFPSNRTCEEKIINYFIDELLSEGKTVAEEIRNELTEKEEDIVNGTAGEKFNVDLLALKKRIIKYYNYYSQILDIVETLEENDNEILDENNLIHITNLSGKVSHLKDDINSLSSMADHLQDAYATFLDQRMNSTMKIFTIITTIFFPLTIIVGWYGMNFKYMPELNWRLGYPLVILLSVAIVSFLVVLGKRKKWF